MPLEFGPLDLVRDEVQRFREGLQDVADGGEARARAAAARAGPAGAGTRTINIPGWDDVIRLRPKIQVTSEQRDLHYTALKSGRPSPLSPEMVDQLDRNRDRAHVMRTSASPEYSKGWGQMMTAIDNVQDLMTTVAVVGRISLNPALRALEGIGTTRVALLAPAARVGAFGIGRLIPFIGPILLVGDLLKLLNIIGIWAFPFFTFACRGFSAGVVGTVPALVLGTALCARIGHWAASSPFGRKARLRRSRTIRNWRPSIYNLVEVAQTTESLYGVGVSFGGAVGLVSDVAFATELSLRGERVHVETTQLTKSIHRVYEDPVKKVATPILQDLRAAANVLTMGVFVQRTNEDFTLEEHMEAMAAYSAALALLREWIQLPQTVDAMHLALDAEWTPPTGRTDLVTAELLDAGEDPRGTLGSWPLPGNPRTITGQQMLELGPDVTDGLRRLLARHQDTPEAAFMGTLACRIMERTMLLLTGAADSIQFQVEPFVQIAATLARRNRVVNTAADEDAILRAFEAAAAWMEEHGRREIPDAVLDELFSREQVPLLRLVPPETWQAQAR